MNDDHYVFVWLGLFAAIAAIVASFCCMSAANNRWNTGRDNYYAAHCTVVHETFSENSSTRSYVCQEK